MVQALTNTQAKMMGISGSEVNLRDIAVILSEQNQVLAITAESQQKLTNSFGSYLKMLQGQEMDDLQNERRTKSDTSTAVAAGAGFSMAGLLGKLGDGKGFLSSLLGFLKRLVPVALGILFGDDLLRKLKPMIEDAIGTEISSDIMSAIMGAAGGGLLGFLFGGFKGGLFGLVLGALSSEGVRNKIVESVNKALGTELEANDWQAWALSLTGAFAVLWGPSLLKGAVTKFLAGAAGKKATEEVGKGLISNLFKNPRVLAAMTLGMRGLLIGAIGYLAVMGAKALIDFFRDKNFEMFDKATKEADDVIQEYKRTGDVSVLEKGAEKLGKAQTESRRMLEIGQGSGRYEEAQKSMDDTSLALGLARGNIDSQLPREARERAALQGGLADAMDYAMARAYKIGNGNPDQGDYLQAALELGSSKAMKQGDYSAELKAAFGVNAMNTANLLMERANKGVSQQARAAMDNYGARSTGNVIAPIDNSQMNQITNSSSSPLVLPNGGATDNNDNKSKMFLAPGL